MNIKILTHIMPWEMDYALLMFEKLKKASYYLSPDDTIYIDTNLNLTSYLVNWEKSKLPKEFLIEKYKTISKLLDWANHKPFIYEGNELWGHLDSHKTTIEPHIDYYITICPDTYFHEHLLYYLIESAKSIKDKYFVITPQIYKMWDQTWDILTHPNYQNVPYDKWNEGDVFDIANFLSNNEQTPVLTELNQFKYAGWFDIYSKSFIEELVPVFDEWRGYGPWDYFGMLISGFAKQNGVNVKEYLLENQVIFEHSTGDFKDNHFSTYYKNQLVLNDVPNQRKIFESKMKEYLDKGIKMLQEKEII